MDVIGIALTRNYNNTVAYKNNSSYAAVAALTLSVLLLLGAVIFTTVFLQNNAQAAEHSPVSVTASSYQETSVLEYKNAEDSSSEIKSITLEIKGNANFKSFKTEDGWLGKKTGPNTIKFTATQPLSPGDTIRLGIKTTTSNPTFSWKAFELQGNQIGKSDTVAVGRDQQENNDDNDNNDGNNNDSNTDDSEDQNQDKPVNNKSDKPDSSQNTKTQQKQAILSDSRFRLIPDEPSVGSKLRVVGEQFGPTKPLDFYIGDKKTNSIVTKESGRFVFSTTIPESIGPGTYDFVVQDKDGNKKTVKIRIKEKQDRNEILIEKQQQSRLTVDPIGDVKPGDDKIIRGTAAPGKTITVTLVDPSRSGDSDQLTTMTTEAGGNGAYKITHKVPVDRPAGQYKVVVSDGEQERSTPYSIIPSGSIQFESPQVFDRGETINVDVIGPPNEQVEISIIGPDSTERYFELRQFDESGNATVTLPLKQSAMEGTYTVKARYKQEIQTYFVGVGQDPRAKLTLNMDKTNYQKGETARLSMTGPANSRTSLVIVDPSGREKLAETVVIDPYGVASYRLNLTDYSTGVYTAVLTWANSDVEKRFTVGLSSSSGPIDMRIVKEEYFAGEKVLVIGNTKPDSVVSIEMLDPNGTKIKSMQVFSDRKGLFSTSDIKIPDDAKQGEWSVRAFSGINHMSKTFEVLRGISGDLTVTLDKDPPEYTTEENVFIAGHGAGTSSKTVVITIQNEEGIQIDRLTIFSTKDGFYKTQWNIPDDFPSGTYTLTVDVLGEQVQTSFTVI